MEEGILSKETATELEYLKWFYCNADFGPSDSEIQDNMKIKFIKYTHKYLPTGYNYMSDGETNINKYYKDNYEK